MSTVKKVNCAECNTEFETKFQGKTPKCKSCIQKSKEAPKEVPKETVKEVVKEVPNTNTNTDSPKKSEKKKVNCSVCKVEFESAFQGKTPKCTQCIKNK